MATLNEPVRLSRGLPLALSAETNVGHVRDNNEDAFGHAWCADGSLLAVVCDGMGGHQAGEVASRIAVDTLASAFEGTSATEPQQALHDAMIAANEAIIEQAATSGQRGMGTTAVAAVVRGDRAFVGLIGDSRLYHVRSGVCLTRTRDHTRVESRLQAGEITEAQTRDHPESGILTRALGHRKMANRQPLKPDILPDPLALREGDSLVLSSDGLHDLVEDGEIASVVAGKSPSESVDALVALALSRGGHDNVTVMVVTAGERASSPKAAPGKGLEARSPEGTGPTLTMDVHREDTATSRRPDAVGRADFPPSIPPDDRRLAIMAAMVTGILLCCSSILVLVVIALG